MTNQKEKGNAFERKISKELSTWIFGDNAVLYRDSTSGGRKAAYVGDIIPHKQIGWSRYPFFIECKKGYDKNIPSFFDHGIVTKWIIKAFSEMTEDQNILMLIVSFHYKPIVLFTNIELDADWFKIIKINEHIIYVYEYNEILKLQFDVVFRTNNLNFK